MKKSDDPKQETQEKNDQLQGTENREISEGHLQPEDPPSRHSYRDVGSSQLQGTENRQVSGGPFQKEKPPSRHSCRDHISLSKGMKPHYADLYFLRAGS